MYSPHIWSISALVLVSGLAVLQGDDDRKSLRRRSHVPEDTALGCFFIESGCILRCNGVEDVRQVMIITYEKFSLTADLLQNANCTVMTALQIHNSTFSGNELQFMLFKSIYELEVKDCNINYIDQEAFASPAFETTFSVTLENINVKYLQGGVLLGLAKLEFLTITSPLERINRSFFQPARTSLERLKLSGMTERVKLEDIFGISRMQALKHLDLSNNKFGILSNKEALINLPALHSLRLESSNIEAITADIFEPIISHLRTLDLSDNKLTTISPEVFSSLLCKRSTYIYLEGNEWNCNCSLKEFAELLRNTKEMFVDMLYCKKPKLYSTTLIVDVNYSCTNGSTMPSSVECPEDYENTSTITDTAISSSSKVTLSTTTATSTTPSTTAALTSVPSKRTTSKTAPTSGSYHDFFVDGSKSADVVHITCGVSRNDVNAKHDKHFDHVHVGVPLYEFFIELVSKNSVVITVDDFDSFPVILWYDDPQRYKIRNPRPEMSGCKLYDEKHVLIDNLNPNTTYTFCLVPLGESAISPFNCQPFYIPALSPNENEVWLTYEEKALAIGLYCVLIVCCFCIGGIISYLVVCENPTLLRGSKHVFIVEECDSEKVSTIYGSSQDKNYDIYDSKYNKATPPPPYERDERSLYEEPVKLSPIKPGNFGDDIKEDITYLELCPKSPPPVSRREPEIYTVIKKY